MLETLFAWRSFAPASPVNSISIVPGWHPAIDARETDQTDIECANDTWNVSSAAFAQV